MKDRLDTWISKVKSGSSSAHKQTAENREQKSDTKHTSQNTKHETRNTNQKPQKRGFFSRKKNLSSHSQSQSHPHSQASQKGGKNRLRVIPLGGLNEVGRNCMALEYGNDIIIVDAGLQFPGEGMLGVDKVLPDTRYVEQKKQNIRAIIITHAHLDHIGGLPYLLPKLGYPTVYAPPLSVGLIEKQIREHEVVAKNAKVVKIDPQKDVLRFGAFTIEYFHVNHSIPDCSGLYIQTPTAKVVHTGDFKFDFTPADGVQTDYSRMAKIGERGVDAIFSDSTNAQKGGFCVSEKVVAENLERIIRENTKGRILITSFASLLGRWQQIIRFAHKYNRKVYVTGRSLLENLKIAHDTGFIKVPPNLIHKVSKRMLDTPANQQLIISTGSQGEENAAMSRIVRGEHHIIQLNKGDSVVFSASPIPGNERRTIDIINRIYKIGAKVITRQNFDIHTSGHAHQGDLKLMYALMKPKNIIPIHGEFHMRSDHQKMVQEDLGFKPENTALLDNGEVLEVFHDKIHRTREKVPGEQIFVDGNMVGDVGPEIQEDRNNLMNSGVISFVFYVDQRKRSLKSPPHVQSLGFAYPHESRHLHSELRKEAMEIANQVLRHHGDPKEKEQLIVRDIEHKLSGKIVQMTEREPMVMVTVVVD